MKKRVCWLFAALLCVAMLFAAAACGGDGGKKDNQLEFTFADFNYNEEPSEPVVTLQPLGGTIEYTYAGRGDTVYAESENVPVNVGTYTITGKVAETDEYKAVEYSVDFSILRAAPEGVVFPEATGSVEYGDTLADVPLSSGTGEGTFAWKDATVVPTIANEGYEMVFTPDDANYNSVTQVVEVTVTRKKITEITFPTVESFVYNAATTLENVTLTGADSDYGTFAWEVPSTVPTVKDSAETGYKMRFIPADSLNYDFSEAEGYNPDTMRVERMIKFTVTKAAAPASITFPATIELTYGTALKNAAVPVQAGGTFVWEAPDTVPSNGETAVLVFYADRDNYDYTNYAGEPLDNEGRIEKTVTVKIIKVEAEPEGGFVQELFIAADASIAEMVRGGVTLGDLTLPAGYYVAEDARDTVVYAGFADEVSLYYNNDPNNYLNSEEQYVMLYVENANAVQPTGENGANIVTTGLASKNLMVTQMNTMEAPQNVEYLTRFTENDTVRISGNTSATIVNFIWAPKTIKNATLGNPDFYANINVRFYIKNNIEGPTNFSFKAGNGAIGLDQFQYGLHVVEMTGGKDGAIYWAINGDNAWTANLDGSGAFIGPDAQGYFAVALPFILWDGGQYDFEITLVMETSAQPFTVEGDALTLTQSDILTPTTVRMDDGQIMDMYALSRAGLWNNFWVSVPVNKSLRDLDGGTMAIHAYVYTHQCDEDGSQSISFGRGVYEEGTLVYAHPGNLNKMTVSMTAQEWLEYLTSDTPENLRNSCLRYNGQVLCKDDTGYYIMQDGKRVDVAAAQALDATFDLYISIAGAPMDVSLLLSMEIIPGSAADKAENQLEFTFADFNYGAQPSGPVVTKQPFEGTIAYTYIGRGDTVYAESSEMPVNVGTYTVIGYVAETNGYKAVDYAVDFEICRTALTGVVFPAPTGSVEYGGTLADVPLSGGTGDGSFAWKEPDTKLAVGSASYEMVFTPSDSNYDSITQTVEVTVMRKVIAEITFPTFESFAYDPETTLADVTLAGGSNEYGTFAWEDPSAVPTVATAAETGYKMVFTPADGVNYDFSGVDGYNAETGLVERMIKFTVVESTVPASVTFPTVESFVYDPNKTLADVVLSGQDGDGTFAWEDPSAVPTVATAAETGYKMVFTPADSVNYDYSGVEGYDPETGLVERMIKFTVTKAAAPASVTFPATIELTYGTALKDVAVPVQAGGTFVWEAPDTVPSDGESVVLVFYADRDNYDYTDYAGEPLDNEGRIEKTVTVVIQKTVAEPEGGFVQELFIAADASIAEMVRGGVTLGDLTLPAGYYVAEDARDTVVYAGFADEVSLYYNNDPNNYLNSEEQYVMLYVENANVVQSTGENGANIFTTGIAAKSGMVSQEHVMEAPQSVEYLTRFAENDTVRISGSNITQTTIVNFIWKPGTLKNAAKGSPVPYVNANVRFYIKNNVEGPTNFEFKAGNGGVSFNQFQYGMNVVDLPAADAGSSFYWGINGSPAFGMDGGGSFVGVDETGAFVFAIPFILWDGGQYDFEITLVMEPALEPITVEGTPVTLTQSDILTPTTVRMDNGELLDMYALTRAGGYNNYWINLPVGKSLRELGSDVMTIRWYIYTHNCAEFGSMGLGFAGTTIDYPKDGCLSAQVIAHDAQGWLALLTTATAQAGNCKLIYNGAPLSKDDTGYYIMQGDVRQDVSADQALDATFDLYMSLAGHPYDVSLLYTLEVAPAV